MRPAPNEEFCLASERGGGGGIVRVAFGFVGFLRTPASAGSIRIELRSNPTREFKRPGPPLCWRTRPFESRGGGIRTHETLRFAGFQDQCIQPLCHPSNWDASTEESGGKVGGFVAAFNRFWYRILRMPPCFSAAVGVCPDIDRCMDPVIVEMATTPRLYPYTRESS